MLARQRAPDGASPSYAVVWSNLRKRFPGLRTILMTAASAGDDASIAALNLAEAATGLDGGSALVLVLDSAMPNRRQPETPADSVRLMVALSPGQVRAILADAGQEFPVVIVVAPPPQRDAECIAVGALADAAILVARDGRTRFGAAQLAAELLRQAGISTAAAILISSQARLRQRPAGARQAVDTGQIAELRPRGQLNERREATAGLDLLS